MSLGSKKLRAAANEAWCRVREFNQSAGQRYIFIYIFIRAEGPRLTSVAVEYADHVPVYGLEFRGLDSVLDGVVGLVLEGGDPIFQFVSLQLILVEEAPVGRSSVVAGVDEHQQRQREESEAEVKEFTVLIILLLLVILLLSISLLASEELEKLAHVELLADQRLCRGNAGQRPFLVVQRQAVQRSLKVTELSVEHLTERNGMRLRARTIINTDEI